MDKIVCENCRYCQYPRSSNEWGYCKCKIMKYKPIDILVCERQIPSWCPLTKKKEDKK